jgi:hypothetical protein
MSSDPAQRPASAGDLARRLEAALEPEQPRRAAAGTPPPTRHHPTRRRSLLAPVLLALAALAVAAVIVATLAGGGTPSRSGASASRGTARRTPARTTAGSATTRRSSTSATTSTISTNPATGASSAATAPATGAPASAVEQFYEAAARHQYAAAWALADSNLRNQLGGYASFEHQMSTVRSITFHTARALSASSSDTATVALSTTSVQTDRTQQCTGTAGTVRSGGTWLVHRISISCSGSPR